MSDKVMTAMLGLLSAVLKLTQLSVTLVNTVPVGSIHRRTCNGQCQNHLLLREPRDPRLPESHPGKVCVTDAELTKQMRFVRPRDIGGRGLWIDS
jgi:hypothetical protein